MSKTQEVRLQSITRPVDLLIVAGEHSGDEHAARMLRAVKAHRPGLVAAAVGGPRLKAAGAQLLFDLTAQSSLGFEVLKKISFYRRLIAEIVRWIGEHRPRAVCFVDSSALNLRIAERMYEQRISARAGGPTKALYFISPQIWASRAGRRFRMARHLDGLAAIFPFEPRCYADTRLQVEFIGHPFVAADYSPPVRYEASGPVLLLPGSRRQAVSRIFPVLLEGFRALGEERAAVVLYPSTEILSVLKSFTPPPTVKLVRIGEAGTDSENRPAAAAGSTVSGPGSSAAPLGASAVLTSSGTMSMHCALAGIPGAVVYKTDPLTYFLGRMLVRVDYLGIANLLLGEPMYPEYIQKAATPGALARELTACLHDPARRERTEEQAGRLRAKLAQPASGSAADWLLRQLEGS